MIYKIKKGKRKPWPPVVGINYAIKTMRRNVTFLYGCNYWIEGESMQAVNKLFGIKFPVQHETVFFGWRYDNAQSIILSAHCDIEGKETNIELCRVPIFTKITMALYVHKEFYSFDVLIDGAPKANEYVAKYNKRKLSFPIGISFAQPAPQNIIVEIKKN